MDNDFDSQPDYVPFKKINFHLFAESLQSLKFLGDDMFLRIQAENLALVDRFITELEYQILQELYESDRTPRNTIFLSAQSQMWIFAIYELLRTWRQRATTIITAFEAGRLPNILAEYSRIDEPYNFNKKFRIEMISSVIENPSLIEVLKLDFRRTSILFLQLEQLRMPMAKHELPKAKNSVPSMPGYGRINRLCGSLDHQIESSFCVLGYLSRRDIADGVRAFRDLEPPSDEEITEAKKAARGISEEEYDELRRTFSENVKLDE